MKYTITVKKFAKAIVEVEADSKSNALSKAAHEYEHGSVLWEPVQCKVKIEEQQHRTVSAHLLYRSDTYFCFFQMAQDQCPICCAEPHVNKSVCFSFHNSSL